MSECAEDPILTEFTKFWNEGDSLITSRRSTRLKKKKSSGKKTGSFPRDKKLNSKNHAKEAEVYDVGDLVAIKRTQFMPMSKLAQKYLGPYQIVSRRGLNRFEVTKIGDCEGPGRTWARAEIQEALAIK